MTSDTEYTRITLYEPYIIETLDYVTQEIFSLIRIHFLFVKVLFLYLTKSIDTSI